MMTGEHFDRFPCDVDETAAQLRLAAQRVNAFGFMPGHVRLLPREPGDVQRIGSHYVLQFRFELTPGDKS